MFTFSKQNLKKAFLVNIELKIYENAQNNK